MRTTSGTDRLVLLCVLALCLLAFSAQVLMEPAPAREAAAAPPAAPPSPEVGELEARIENLSRSLEHTTRELNATLARLRSIEQDAQQEASAQERLARIERARESVPSPLRLERDGEEVLLFSAVPDPMGKPLAENVIFNARYGSRLVFRKDDGLPLGFDVSEVHPGVLGHLGIDPAIALEEQRRLDERKRERIEEARRQRVARRQAELEWLEAKAEADAERARLLAEENQARAHETAQARSQATQDLVATAALLAVQRSQQPSTVVYRPYYVPFFLRFPHHPRHPHHPHFPGPGHRQDPGFHFQHQSDRGHSVSLSVGGGSSFGTASSFQFRQPDHFQPGLP